jgi:hypothetical protein
LAATVYLGLDESTQGVAFWLLVAIDALFLVGAVFGNSRHPYGIIFKALVRPRLAPPKELEDAAPPQFAQAVGFFVASIGVVLGALAVPYGVAIAAGAAFIAAFLNAAFAYCLGCQIYLGLKRLKVIR